MKTYAIPLVGGPLDGDAFIIAEPREFISLKIRVAEKVIADKGKPKKTIKANVVAIYKLDLIDPPVGVEIAEGDLVIDGLLGRYFYQTTEC